MSVFENIRCSLLWSRGYKYSFWQMVSKQRKLNEDAERILERIHLQSRRNVLAGFLFAAGFWHLGEDATRRLSLCVR